VDGPGKPGHDDVGDSGAPSNDEWKRRALLFFQQKKQKTLICWRLRHRRCQSPQQAKVFCFFFSKKKRLLAFS
jgi:hypothetical protein